MVDDKSVPTTHSGDSHGQYSHSSISVTKKPATCLKLAWLAVDSQLPWALAILQSTWRKKDLGVGTDMK